MSLEPENVFDFGAARYFSIASNRFFLKDLARTLRASLSDKPGIDLADAVIYLPTRRAVRALNTAFLETSDGARASLMPRIRALGDIDEDEFVAFEGAAEDEIELPPAIKASERRLALAKLVSQRDKAYFDGQHRWAGAIAAADELGKLLDSLYTEEIDPSRLEKIAPEALAEHWAQSLAFLTIITHAWPAFLKEGRLTDPARRRVTLIDRQTRRWQATPPHTPVIIAGTTGSTPAVARMMETVAALPMGCVVLPGLDHGATQPFWEAIDEPHPQYGLKQLLAALKTSRSDVKNWPKPVRQTQSVSGRRQLLAVALTPARASDSWRDWAQHVAADKDDLLASLAGVELAETRDEETEAAAIALKLRETLDEKDKTAMLATPDRDLARRVSMKMRRWNVVVDDSAGVPFANTPCGTFLRLTAEWLLDISNPVALLAVLDHPLFGGGLTLAAARSAVLNMDARLRGLPPMGGAAGLAQKLKADESLNKHAETVLALIAEIAALWPPETAPFIDRFDAHLAIAERLAATNDESGALRLWRGEDGEAGAALLAQLRAGLGHIVHDRPEDYADIFTRLIATAVVRRQAPAHPRLSILGPLEARLQTADVVILGGLNEGVWPRDAAIDPFLSRPMRKTLGLPSPEQRIGLAAHDFMQLAAAPSVMLTRATRAGGKPTKPSRWIVRLKNILKGAGALAHIDRTHFYETLAQRLDAPQTLKRIEAPQPRPPLDVRPKEFFVTRIEKLMRDPYSIYARDILRLKKLDALGETFAARHMGNLLHKILQDYAQTEPPKDRAARIQNLNDLFRCYAGEFGLTEEHHIFWDTRINAAIAWFEDWDADRRALGAPVITEDHGAWTFKIDGVDYRLSARADRIDQLQNGAAFIIDYKSGTPPTLAQNKTFSPQLPLTGLITANGGFEKLDAVPVEGFEYVRILNRKNNGKDDVGVSGEECADLMKQSKEGLTNLFRHFNNPGTAYSSQPRAQYADQYGDYDHLARRQERNAQGGEE